MSPGKEYSTAPCSCSGNQIHEKVKQRNNGNQQTIEVKTEEGADNKDKLVNCCIFCLSGLSKP